MTAKLLSTTLFVCATALVGHAVAQASGGDPGVEPRQPSCSARILTVDRGTAIAHILARSKPQYPFLARCGHVHGRVVVKAQVSKEGKVVCATVLSGPAMLAGAAVDAVRQYRFAPFQVAGAPSSVWAIVVVPFFVPR